MTRILVAENLPQGPTPIMAVRRGAPVPRFTFHMTLDSRIRYTFVTGGLDFAATFDVYNLLGSGTEILEDIRTGETFRQSVEMVPDRAFLLGLEAAWR